MKDRQYSDAEKILRLDIELLKARINVEVAERNKCVAENARLREALNWYAASVGKMIEPEEDENGRDIYEAIGALIEDQGRRARKALGRE